MKREMVGGAWQGRLGVPAGGPGRSAVALPVWVERGTRGCVRERECVGCRERRRELGESWRNG